MIPWLEVGEVRWWEDDWTMWSIGKHPYVLEGSRPFLVQ